MLPHESWLLHGPGWVHWAPSSSPTYPTYTTSCRLPSLYGEEDERSAFKLHVLRRLPASHSSAVDGGRQALLLLTGRQRAVKQHAGVNIMMSSRDVSEQVLTSIHSSSTEKSLPRLPFVLLSFAARTKRKHRFEFTTVLKIELFWMSSARSNWIRLRFGVIATTIATSSLAGLISAGLQQINGWCCSWSLKYWAVELEFPRQIQGVKEFAKRWSTTLHAYAYSERTLDIHHVSH